MIWVRDGALRHCPVPIFYLCEKSYKLFVRKLLILFHLSNIIYMDVSAYRKDMRRMKYMSTFEAAEKWGISHRRVSILCNQDRIPGAQRAGSRWIIPEDAEKPSDARIKSGKYMKLQIKEGVGNE